MLATGTVAGLLEIPCPFHKIDNFKDNYNLLGHRYTFKVPGHLQFWQEKLHLSAAR